MHPDPAGSGITTDLLQSLKQARWQTAFRTYGNDHSTLIGLLVDWWVSGSPEDRWALEGGPSFGYHPKGIGGGLCDAILGEGAASRGVVEVEGTRWEETLHKIGKFFGSQHSDLRSLEFGIFLAYAYEPKGRGPARTIPWPPLDCFIALGKRLTREHRGRQLVILTLEKRFERQTSGPRARNEYYAGTPCRMCGALLQDGHVLRTDVLVEASPGHTR